MGGVTLDTGALIGLERSRTRVANVVGIATAERRPITVPAVVIAEWWRGATFVRGRLSRFIQVEPVDETLAKLAGEALAWLGKRAGVDASVTIDALVMASAARRGDVVYTADIADLRRFQSFFPGVKVLAV
jgi:predicted nucleic acid-binding protein